MAGQSKVDALPPWGSAVAGSAGAVLANALDDATAGPSGGWRTLSLTAALLLLLRGDGVGTLLRLGALPHELGLGNGVVLLPRETGTAAGLGEGGQALSSVCVASFLCLEWHVRNWC